MSEGYRGRFFEDFAVGDVYRSAIGRTVTETDNLLFTMLALNTTNNEPGSGYPAHAPFLLIAHFTALNPTAPLPAVSSQPGP